MSILGAVLGAGISIVGGLLGRKAAGQQAGQDFEALRVTAEEQFALSTTAIKQKAAISERGLNLEALQDELFTRLSEIQIRQQADIAVARRRTQQQQVRIGGIGGSFTRIRAGESEVKTAVQRQIEQLRIERTARTEQRAFELFTTKEQERLSLGQAGVTRSAGIRGASQVAAGAISAANIGLVQNVAGVAGSLASNPAVVGAIGDFFSGFGSSGGSPFVSTSNPLGLTIGQGL